MEEKWVDIHGFEGEYQVSNYGRVRSLDRMIVFKDGRRRRYKGKVLSITSVTSSGYLEVKLSRNHTKISIYVHRLVAEHFCPNPDGKPTVNHNDENKFNNRADNLCWMTQGENNTANGLAHRKNYNFSEKCRESLKRVTENNRKPVEQYDMNWNFIARYSCADEAMLSVEVKDRQYIAAACRNPRRTAGGYRWKYSK